MICYKDMTFCPFWKKCNKGVECERALIEEVEKEAGKCGLGICQFMDKPECFESKK